MFVAHTVVSMAAVVISAEEYARRASSNIRPSLIVREKKAIQPFFNSRGSMARFLNSSHNHQREIADVIIYDPDVDELGGEVEVLLWRIFTYYSINGNPQNPMFLRAQTFVEFCLDARLINNTTLLKQDCTVIYKDIVSKRADKVTGRGSRRAGGYAHGKPTLSERARQLQLRHDPEKRHVSIKKMNFSDFTNSLSRISSRIMPHLNPAEAFEKVLDDKIFRFAHRRPVNHNITELDLCNDMFDLFAPSLRLILQYYGEFRPEIENNEDHGATGRRFSLDKDFNSMACAMSFRKWLHFCDDFNLRSSMNNTPILTSIQLSEIFLNSVKAHIVDHIGKLTFEEFWEALVRCALVAYRKHECHVVLKLKELFVYMTNKIENSVSKHINAHGKRDVTTNAANGLAGMKGFQFRVTEMYRRDGVPRTYLIREAPPEKSGRDLLKNIKKKRQDAIYTLNGGVFNDSPELPQPGPIRGAVQQGKGTLLGAMMKSEKGSAIAAEKHNKQSGSPQKVHDPTLKAPWRAAMDPNGAGIYYYNRETGMTTWERPV